ncbi:MAG: carbamoyltransferase HypF [Lachnospiraceae bacterium]|nr:carbamoyltransferase HypF [Lachnospiraceae bacterium]
MERPENAVSQAPLWITVTGTVQGVGFRPFVRMLADEHHLAGLVENCGGIVRILVTEGGQDDIAAFLSEIRERAPVSADVLTVTAARAGNDAPVEKRNGTDRFVIAESETSGDGLLPAFVPDLAVCDDCLAEMADPANRRFRYPLISCAQCGPRFTIFTALPYDRERTSMRDFVMCPACGAEYTRTDPVRIVSGKRRLHAQTISCHDCGPQICFVTPEKARLTGEAAVAAAAGILREGGVIGLKGIGGFQLLADPRNDAAVRRLREMKGRETKPFAVLFSDPAAVREFCEVNGREERALVSAARPIVLLTPRRNGTGKDHADTVWSSAVLSGSAFIGAFLPAAGVHRMLTDACGPLIATSANISDDPMDHTDEAFAAHFLRSEGNGAADGVLTHPRRILSPIDDSVVYADGDALCFIRRARGYVPLPVSVPAECGSSRDILAFGADMKAAFAFARGERIVLSQPFGDLENLSVRRAYLAELERLSGIYGLHPETVVCDAHPAYHSAAIAAEYCARNGLREPMRIYHHHAHALAAMAENGLSSCVAVVCDGTGFGPDGTIWGGEVLFCHDHGETGCPAFERKWHLPGFRLPGGDAAARDAALSAAAWLMENGEDPGILRLAGDKERMLRAAHAAGGGVFTTSLGRLFDAVSALLGIARENRFEGECAQALEGAAHRYLRRNGDRWEMPEDAIDAEGLPAALCERIRRGEDREQLAFWFHAAISRALSSHAAQAADRRGERHIVLAGGSFVNRILVRLVRSALEKRGFLVSVCTGITPGDGGIAVGQTYAAMRCKENEIFL